MVRPFQAFEKGTSFRLVDLDTVRNNRGWFVMLGLALMVLGLLAILLPLVAALATTIFLGWLMLVAGLIEGYHALRTRPWVGVGPELVSAVVQVVAGGLMVIFPMTGKLALTAILA